MMEKISQLMDGELGAHESRRQIRRMGSDHQLTQSWDTYHLIGDTLRDEAELSANFMERLHERLEQEPAIVAPHTRLAYRVTRYTLPMAAGLAGVVIVAWLALSSGNAPDARLHEKAAVLAKAPGASSRTPIARAVVTDGMADYLRAHQEFSPSTAMQGVASYVRTVSSEEPTAGQ